jgi:putative ABC transport system permease protein
MTGWAVLKTALSTVFRRRVQAAVIVVVAAAAAVAALLGLTLATSSNAAFQAGFIRYRVADLAMTVDSAKVTAAELARTRHLPGVTEAVGYPATTITITIPGTPGYEGGAPISGPVTVEGRASRSGPLDDITPISGRWPTRQGEIDQNDLSDTRGSVGQVTTATVTSLPAEPKLTIVGYAEIPGVQDETQGGWVVPGEITALEKAGAPAQEEMLYTFSHAATPAQVSADLSELRAALPAGAITSSSSGLGALYARAGQSGTGAPSAVAYALIAVLLAAAIIASVAAAAVAASYRRIGVLKSIGFTPAQVVASCLTQLGIPALAGSVAGTEIGDGWARPLIDPGDAHVTIGVPLWINITVPAGMLALTWLTALVPALRAGRLPTAAAIAAGQAPPARRGGAADRLAAALPLPRAVTAGLAAPFTRPARSAATLATLTFGLAAVVLAVGLNASMTRLVLSGGHAIADTALVLRLTLLVAGLAGLGVFTAVLMQARELVHDLGVYKALGMTPGQVITLIACWAVAPAIVAAGIALPAGIALEGAVARAVVSAQAGPLATAIGSALSGVGAPGAPPIAVRPTRRTAPGRPAPLVRTAAYSYSAGELALLALAGLVIALAGALGPATWAATSRATTALHTE